MKLLLGLLVSLAISSAFALPARSPKDEVDVIDVPEPRGPFRSSGSNANDDDSDADTDFRDFKGVVDTGAGYPFLAPHPFTFSMGFFDSFEDIFRRLRTRLWSAASDEDSDEGGFSLSVDPPKGANTTSVVKVVDGHKIEINDTVYGNGDGSNNAVFKFRVIKIRPLDSGEEVSEGETVVTQSPPPTSTKPRDIEGNSDENDDSDDEVKPDENENEINHNVNDPEITTIEAITTEMHDTVPHRIQTSDNNAVNSDNPIEQDDQLQVDIVADATAPTELLDDDVASLLEDNTNSEGPVDGAYKSEKLSAFVDAENVNDGSDDDLEQAIQTESTISAQELDLNESVDDVNLKDNNDDNDDVQEENQEAQEMDDLVDTLGEQLAMIDHEADNDQETDVEQSQNLQDHHTSLREDVSSSDDEDDKEPTSDDKYEGLNAEWGNLDDKNILTNEIDVYESVPIDLSNDIAVNDIMADQGAPINPDAEIFNVDEVEPSAGESITGRRFEVLSDIK